MSISKSDFWKLVVESQLLTREQCQHVSNQFAKVPSPPGDAAKPLAVWLVRQNVLSKYQATILLSGRPGPFVFGDYKVTERIEGDGRLGGMFRAVHAATDHPVHLKFLTGSAARLAQPWDEIVRWVALTDHPHISRCYEAVQLPKYKFLVFEDLRGQTLTEVLQRSGRISADESSRLARSAAVALAHLHASGRAHGNVRPDYLWLEPTGSVKLFVEPEIGTRRFDVATAATEPDGLARSDYAAPEFLQVGRAPDALSDVYALGCTLYQLVAGQPPFAGGDVESKLRRHASEAIQSLEAYDIPTPLMQLIAYAMAKNPAVRTRQASVVADQLAPFAGAAQLNSRVAAPAKTLSAYESWLRQKHRPTSSDSPTSGLAAAMAPVSVATRPAGSADATVFPAGGNMTPDASEEMISGGASIPGAGFFAPSGTMTSAGETTSSSVVDAVKRRNRSRRRNKWIVLAASFVGVLSAVMVGVWALNNSGNSSNRAQLNIASTAVGSPPSKLSDQPNRGVPDLPATTNSQADPSVQIVVDDGRLLWASPTSGQPISLKHVPSGGQLFLIVRPAELMETDEGQRVVKALGPEFEAARTAWETSAGVKFDEVEQLVVAMYGNDGKTPKTLFVVHSRADLALDDLLDRWGRPGTVEGLAGVYQKGERAYFVPSDDRRTFVMGPLEPEMRDAAAADWKSPPLRREMAQLLQVSDSSRHVTLLLAPNFLFGDGQELFSGPRADAKEALSWFLGDSLKATMVSLHCADEFYVELRAASDIQIDRYQLASKIRERLSQIPDAVELYIARVNPSPYWRLVANRYPGMIRFLHQQSRIGVEGDHAAVNAVLPGVAAHNLTFGGEMLLASTSGATVAANGVPSSNSPQTKSPQTKSPQTNSPQTNSPQTNSPKTVDDVLKSRISISFAQDSLEFAMRNVADEVKATFPSLPVEFKIKIIGPDLEKDGITRNQQVRDFEQRDKTVAEVLTAMVRKANPITTVKDPTALEQKLIWVVGPDPENASNQIVLVTTRAGADRKKYALPEVFRPK